MDFRSKLKMGKVNKRVEKAFEDDLIRDKLNLTNQMNQAFTAEFVNYTEDAILPIEEGEEDEPPVVKKKKGKKAK
jgi:hypothetical protein